MISKHQLPAIPLSPYEQNRLAIPIEELRKHEGKWAAFSRDGSRILASDADLAALDRRLIAEGLDPFQVVLEFVDLDEISLGAAANL